MAYTAKEYQGAAAATTLQADITSGSTSFSAVAATAYPTGSGGNFVIILDRGKSTEEKILCSSRTSNSFTVAASGRGYDGTTAVGHTAGAALEHSLTATDLSEANVAVVNTVGRVSALGDLLVGSGPNALSRLAIGTAGQVATVVGGTVAWGGAVTSFNGRTGAVSPVAADYVKTHRLSSTYAISGAVGNVTLPLFEVGLAAGETKTVVKVITKLAVGSLTAQLTRNTVNLGAAISVTTSKLVTAISQALSDGDDLAVVLSAGASSPTDLTFTVEYDSAS